MPALGISPPLATLHPITPDAELAHSRMVPRGNPSVFLTHDLTGGVVVVNGLDGEPAASLPDAGFDRRKGEDDN